MPLGIDVWVDFGGFWEEKWSQVGTKIGSKIDINFESQKLDFVFRVYKIGAKINEKSFEKYVPR